MKRKLLNVKEQTPQCATCVHARVVEGDAQLLCVRDGVVEATDVCRRYEYDPLKRKPVKHRLAGWFTPEDFAL